MADEAPDFDPDLFVAWLADVQEGRIDELQSSLCWAADTTKTDANRWLVNIDRLGHCEIDWKNRTWSARPLQVTPLPGPVQCSLVVGTKPHPDLAEGLDGFVIARAPGRIANIPLPATLWYEGSEKEAGELLDAEPIPCEAARIAHTLRPLAPGRSARGPARTTALSPFDPQSMRFRSARSTRFPRDGLYRYEVYGRWHLVLHRDHRWYEVERNEGIYLVSPPSRAPVEWQPEVEGQCDELALGRLRVNADAPLPRDHDCAAILCTGLPPLTIENHIVYDGVPLWIAERIAESLHRKLEIW